MRVTRHGDRLQLEITGDDASRIVAEIASASVLLEQRTLTALARLLRDVNDETEDTIRRGPSPPPTLRDPECDECGGTNYHYVGCSGSVER